MFTPKLAILPKPQLKLWNELAQTPSMFTLYGGTAIALRLGHRSSVDFGFFAWDTFAPADLAATIPYLARATPRRSAANTLTVTVERDGPVQMSFFGGLQLGQASISEPVEGPGFAVASLLDLAGTKAAVVTERAEAKDYLDIHALLTQARIPLPEMLSSAAIIYGDEFNPLIALKAISYHEDPALADLPASMRADLIAAVRSVDLEHLPEIRAVKLRSKR